jgi:anhydro-N-acetylmuramic acid kinase
VKSEDVTIDSLVAGMMSGTSLDGLDIAFIRFSGTLNKPVFSIENSVTILYETTLQEQLKSAHAMDGRSLTLLDLEYGSFLGKSISSFITETGQKPDIIASHGHTVFHQPDRGMTLQIGHGAAIAREAGCVVINDFRIADVLKGGQGAPLVPVGDRDLFREFSACVNIGGFANLSYELNGKRIAWDITAANMGLNHFAGIMGETMDRDGEIARSGNTDASLLDLLNGLPFCAALPPKSLGREWFDEAFLPVIMKRTTRVRDLLRTLTEHAAMQISSAVKKAGKGKVLFTGGGAHNTFLMERIRAMLPDHSVVVPEKTLVDFKEALVFAWLGLLRFCDRPNILASVTGSSDDHSAGSVWQ